MRPIISPRELAEAIGVSESSLKRWADEGQVRVTRTAGGHRRIAIGDAIRFVRAVRAPLLKPELLGLRDLTATPAVALSAESPNDRLFDYLREGRAREARALVLSLYLEGQSVAEIGDGPIRAAMLRLGELWRHDPAGVFVEHRATNICIQAVDQLRQLVEPEHPAVTAVGGAPPGDPYLLPSMLVAATLAAEGWHAVNLGPNTPFDSLLHAAEAHGPQLVWVSISLVGDAGAMAGAVRDLELRLRDRGAILAVGGQGSVALAGLEATNVRRCETLMELIALSRTFQASVTG